MHLRPRASAPATPEEGEEQPVWSAARDLAVNSAPLAGAVAIFGMTAAVQTTTLSLFLANAVRVAPFLIGLFFTARAAAGIVAGLATGWISDRMRDRRVLIGLTSVGGAAGMLCLAVFRNYAVVLMACVVFASIGSGAFGQLFAYANESATARGRDVTAFSSTIRAVFSAAFVVGSPLGLTIMTKFGFTTLYLASAALIAASAVIGRWGLRRTAPKSAPITPRAARERRPLWQVIRESNLPARVWLLLAVVLVLGVVNQVYNIDISLHVTKDLHRSAQLVGWMLGLTALIEIPVMIVAGRAARRVGSGLLVGLSAVLAIVSYCLMPLVASLSALLAVSALIGVWQGVALSIPMVMVQQETPGGLGVASSLYGAAFGTSGLFAGAVTGITASAVGYGGVLWVSAGLSAVAALLMLARRAHRFRPTPP